MDEMFALALIEEPGDRGCSLADHADAPVADDIAGEAFASEAMKAARRPMRPLAAFECDERHGGGLFHLA
jgi:hypothetical protein